MILDGILLPVATPFHPETLELDTASFEANLRAWSRHPIRGIVVAGSTGEAPFLDPGEIARLVEVSCAALPETALLIAGVGQESTLHTVRGCRDAAERGADAALVRPPSYYRERMTPEALRDHFTEVADRSPIPLILYHIPRFVPVALAPELVGRLAEHPNIAGVKDSSGDLKNLGAFVEACAGNAAVLVGSGAHLYAGLESGAAGGILGVGLLAPARCCEVFEVWRAGRPSVAGRAQEALGPLHRSVVADAGVPGVKHGLDLLGLCGGKPRPPLLSPSAQGRREIAEALAKAGLLAMEEDRLGEPATTGGGGVL